jgi:hypothetical protein
VNIHSFMSGQIVNVAAHSLSGPSSAGHFRVVECYPVRNGPAMYHVHSVAGRGQRMVPEDELSGVMPQVARAIRMQGKVVQLFPCIVPFGRGVTA